MSINVQNISKHFGTFHALDNIQLDIESGELLALLGPSGCGKTTLLRIIAGLETADAGQIVISGEDSTHVHVRERNVGFVFQHYALFRHMTVADNVAFGLRVKPRGERPSEKQIQAKVHDLLKLVQLDWLAERYPAQLSGGQRQRIALARALAVEPKVLLLDEPFGALDAQVRKELRRWLRRLHDELHVTSIFVTHDQEEALEVADRVVLMNHGKIEQVGSPRSVWEHPATPFVARFLGGVPLVGDGTRPLRPHELEVHRLLPGEPPDGGVVATLRRVLVLDPVVRLELECTSCEHELIEARMGTAQFEALGLREGDTVRVTPRPTLVAVDQALMG
jgi:sulfate/thiosulfate transport system ATP-binding protein